MAKKHSQARKDKMAAGQKDSWKDPIKHVEQKKRIEAKRLLKDASSYRIESPVPLNIEGSRQALIDEMKKTDKQGWQILDVFIEYFFMSQRRPLREILNILEEAILIKVLSHVRGNQMDAAKFLGIKYTTMNEKVKKYNIKFFKDPIEN